MYKIRVDQVEAQFFAKSKLRESMFRTSLRLKSHPCARQPSKNGPRIS